ncbi:hypothetical protein [Paraburkholderia sp. J67]|uniref:hypothetical protein n=1 Tax=Paraburkholderia sp. J67 TaxID=2805435 RepID=UPI002ABD207F|nr:hypothetical protein [Paraburkholderia sp. J67]
MSTVIARKPTKKAFFFPTSADAKKAQRKLTTKAETPSKSARAEKASRTKSAANDAAAAKLARSVAAQDAAIKTKGKRTKKEKVIRDSFTMPRTDYERLALLKRKCLDAGVTVKKSELLRAGLQLLDSASSKRLLAALSALETVKTGRPAKGE